MKEKLMSDFFEHGIILLKKHSPEGKGFRLHLHRANPHAPLSPIYIDMGKLRSFPKLLHDVAAYLLRILPDTQYLADVPTGATPIVATMSQLCGMPMVSPRQKPANADGAMIDGVYTQGGVVTIVEDVISTGGSTYQAVQTLRRGGLYPRHVMVVIDRQQGGTENLESQDLTVQRVCTISELLEFGCKSRFITLDELGEAQAYLKL